MNAKHFVIIVFVSLVYSLVIHSHMEYFGIQAHNFTDLSRVHDHLFRYIYIEISVRTHEEH